MNSQKKKDIWKAIFGLDKQSTRKNNPKSKVADWEITPQQLCKISYQVTDNKETQSLESHDRRCLLWQQIHGKEKFEIQ